jgi:hypothetical protein
MDHLKLEWEYEPEGYKVSTPLGRISYLPDFWLPGVEQWAEVKGHLEPNDLKRLCALATGMAKCGSGRDIVVLGNIPRSESIRWPIQLHWHDLLWAVPWYPGRGCPLNRPKQHVDAGDLRWCHVLIDGIPVGTPDWAEEPLDAARQARFEWGEHG